jgi:hypothetical protein
MIPVLVREPFPPLWRDQKGLEFYLELTALPGFPARLPGSVVSSIAGEGGESESAKTKGDLA